MSEREPLSEKQERKKSVGYDATVIEKEDDRRVSTSSSTFMRRTGSSATFTKKPLQRQDTSRSITSRASRAEYHQSIKKFLISGLTLNLCFAAFVVVMGSSLLFGYHIGVLNQPRELIRAFYNETYRERYGEEPSENAITLLWSLTTAIFLPGGMIGAFSLGIVADSLGRKKALLLSFAFNLVGMALMTPCVAAKAPEMLVLGRFIVGIHAGFATGLAPMFLTEIAPFNLRGAFGTVHQLGITIGIFISSVFGLREILGTKDLWPYIMLVSGLPVVFACIVLPFLPETPRYLLLLKKDREGAEKSLRFYRNKKDVSNDMEEMDTEQQHAPVTDTEEEFTTKQLFTTKDLRWPLIITVMLQVAQQLSGINAIFFYSSSIFENSGVAPEQIQYAVVGTNAVNVAMTIVSVPLMDIAGRRKLLLGPMVGMIITLIVIVIAINLQETYAGLSYLAISCIIVYVICFAVGLGPIPQMIGSELFRQGPRPKAMAIGGVFNWLANLIVGQTFESLQEAIGEFTFLIFLILMIIFFLFVFFKVPETKGKTFEEIAHQFAPGDAIEVEVEDDVFEDGVAPSSPTSPLTPHSEDGDVRDASNFIDFDKKRHSSTKSNKSNDRDAEKEGLLEMQDQQKVDTAVKFKDETRQDESKI